ncbi:MAG: hypothetical protein CFE21_13800 [Bacteroidetes bacterium B1(2017)]|nr:MAG: hypothetical protein CFE21_13800 [Bacteroidetes bacterium B1(2017)]
MKFKLIITFLFLPQLAICQNINEIVLKHFKDGKVISNLLIDSINSELLISENYFYHYISIKNLKIIDSIPTKIDSSSGSYAIQILKIKNNNYISIDTSFSYTLEKGGKKYLQEIRIYNDSGSLNYLKLYLSDSNPQPLGDYDSLIYKYNNETKLLDVAYWGNNGQLKVKGTRDPLSKAYGTKEWYFYNLTGNLEAIGYMDYDQGSIIMDSLIVKIKFITKFKYQLSNDKVKLENANLIFDILTQGHPYFKVMAYKDEVIRLVFKY